MRWNEPKIYPNYEWNELIILVALANEHNIENFGWLSLKLEHELTSQYSRNCTQ